MAPAYAGAWACSSPGAGLALPLAELNLAETRLACELDMQSGVCLVVSYHSSPFLHLPYVPFHIAPRCTVLSFAPQTNSDLQIFTWFNVGTS